MTTRLKGPAIFLAQGFGKEGWKTLEECAKTAGSLRYEGMQLPLWVGDLINLNTAAMSTTYCQQLLGKAKEAGCPIVEVANHVETQLVRCTPAYQKLFDGFGPEQFRGNPQAMLAWAQERALLSVRAAKNLGLDRVAAFSGTSIFHLMYPWPQRPAGLVQAAMNALAKAWLPVFNLGEELGVDICFELHPGEDLHDGDSFELFLRYVGNHPRCKILLDLSHFVLAGMTMENMLDYIQNFKDRIRMFHVKDAEFNPTAGGGAYGSFNDWGKRQGRFRSTGDGQIDYLSVFNLLAELGLELWATVEWEDCAGKGWNQGVEEGAEYVNCWLAGHEGPLRISARPHSDGAFDDFAASKVNTALIADILGIPENEVNCNEPPVVV